MDAPGLGGDVIDLDLVDWLSLVLRGASHDVEFSIADPGNMAATGMLHWRGVSPLLLPRSTEVDPLDRVGGGSTLDLASDNEEERALIDHHWEVAAQGELVQLDHLVVGEGEPVGLGGDLGP